MEHEYDEETKRFLAERAEFAAKQAARPIKTWHFPATLCSKTRMGGEVVTATAGSWVGDYPIARVGDIIRYPDGTESQIVSGAGYAMVTRDNQPAAIIGSAIDNGDTIINSLQDAMQFCEFADGDPIPGLLQPGYVPPARAEG